MARAPNLVDGPDALPEADRLGGFPHPRETGELFGHDEAWKTFLSALEDGRVHHAWLLSGLDGIGKATFAYRAARALLELGGPGDLGGEQSARLVLSQAHPRLMVIKPAFDSKTKKFHATIPVDDVRKIKPFVSKTADQGSWRVVLIDQANDLTNAAANAVLKVLEEPPRQTVFFLIAPQPDALLATIRSRCRTLTFQPLRGADFNQAVNQALTDHMPEALHPLSNADCERLQGVSGGSAGRALLLSDGDGQKLIKRVEKLIESLPDVDWREVRALAEDIAAPGQDMRFELATDLILLRISNLAKVQVAGGGAERDLVLANRLIGHDAVASWAGLWERGVRERAETLALNLDRKSLILEWFSDLSARAQPHG